MTQSPSTTRPVTDLAGSLTLTIDGQAVAGAAALRLASLPPEAMAATKRLLKAAYMSGLSEQRKLEEEAASHLEGSAESKEAFSAFMEKRQPKFAE